MKLIILLSACFLLLASGCGESGNVADDDYLPVTAEEVESDVITSTVVAGCRLESAIEAAVTPANPGRIIDVRVKEGDTVHTGDILVELSTDQQYSSAVAAASAGLSAARTRLDNAEADLARAERLLAQGAVSQTEYDMVFALYEASEASVQQARAAYRTASSMEESGLLLAPFSGTVTRVWAREGAVSSSLLVSIAGSGVMQAEMLLSSRHLNRLKEGLPAVFSTSHYPSELFQGEVVSFSQSVDPLSGLVSVMVQFHDPSARLRSGMTGTATLGLETAQDAVVLPLKALIHSGPDSYRAALVRGGTAELVEIETGISRGTMREITSGVDPGDSVIYMGNHLVENGERVRVVRQ
ncbi:MAG: efflux RND transporter periplasmic adaptor subunit [Candidatus Aegiribacteria sp.]|nr:efflux RND transporter periplasmic adaptor subunit [Candidatus Aegiribacteria sp.]MBD3295572.1 efflux RND transporter periplasmic adaptor subunit [Candidatus Fermentibacteria bacterium]